MKLVRIFWDLDKTLLDTEGLLSPILAYLALAVGNTPEGIRHAIDELDAGGFTWERLFDRIGLPAAYVEDALLYCHMQYAQAERYLYPGVREALEALDPIAEQVLVTFGDPTFQRRKWSALSSIHPFFHAAHFVDGVTLGKGAVIASYDATGIPSFFIDDSGRWHTDCERHAPHVTCVLMRFAPDIEAFAYGAGGKKKIVHTHDQVVSLIRRSVG